MHFESLYTYRTRKSDPIFDAVDRILRQQKETREEARAAAESKVKENRNIVHPLHPLGAGMKQLPVAGSHGISPQHEVSQATDKLGRIPNSSTSNGNRLQTLKRAMGSLGSTPPGKLTALGRGSAGSVASSPQVPPSSFETSENLIEHKPPATSGTPFSDDNESEEEELPQDKSPTSGTRAIKTSAVTPLSHICAFIVS